MKTILRILFIGALVISTLAYLFSYRNTISVETQPTKAPSAKVNTIELLKPPPAKTLLKRVSKTQTLEKPSAISSSPFAEMKSFGAGGSGSGLLSQESQQISTANSFSNSKSSQTSSVQIVSSTEPKFPELAKKKNITGYVRLLITIDQSSSVKSIDILESNPEGIFDSAAVDSIKNWKFAAAYQNGSPIEGSIRRKIEFKLE